MTHASFKIIDGPREAAQINSAPENNPWPGLGSHIAKTLQVSSSHLPWEGCAELFNADQEAGERWSNVHVKREMLEVRLGEFSWLIALSEENRKAAGALAEYAPDKWLPLMKLMSLAAANGCDHLEIDGDASTLPEEYGFATFDWEFGQ